MIKVRNVFMTLLVLVSLGTVLIFTGCGKGKEPSVSDIHPQTDYYTCGMHPSVKVSSEEYNKGNKNCPICNMNLTPVYKEESGRYYGCGMEGEEHVFYIEGTDMKTCPVCGMPLKKLSTEEAERLKGTPARKEKKILFYRNPMNPEATSDVPAKDSMGMDYIPVYEEKGTPVREEGVVGRVIINTAQTRLAGVATEPVRRLSLTKEIRTVGKVAYDPEMAIAQDEFISAVKAYDRIREGNIEEISDRSLNLVESSRRKLRLLGLSEDQIKELAEKKEAQTNLILPEDKMWIYGDVYEYELGWVKTGEKIKVTTSSLPGKEFDGVISSVNPVLDPKTRSLRFRASVNNPDLELKPEMYVDVVILIGYKDKSGHDTVMAVPKEAVLDTGLRKIVWVDKGSGEYQARLVETGPEAVAVIDNEKIRVYPILKGLAEGEEIVTKANFLIDSQSQISGVASSAYGGSLDAEDKK